MYSRCGSFIQTERHFAGNPCCSFITFSGAFFRASMASFRNKCKDVFRSRSCFGCCSKPSLAIAADGQSKRMEIQEQTAKKSFISDDFWSTSAGDLENSAIHSQRSVSSISFKPPVELNANSTGTSHPPEFVNHGLLLWNQIRQQWLGNKRSVDKTQVREPAISWNATYESLLGTTNKPFPRRIPLAEMVDFLVDVWEQEGLYD